MGEKQNNIHAALSFSLRYCKRMVVVLAVLLAWECPAQKVKNAGKDERVCLPVEVLQSLITISVDSAEDLLYSHGYQYAPTDFTSDSVRIDTIEGVEIPYSIIYFRYVGDYPSDRDFSTTMVQLLVPKKDLHYNKVEYYIDNVRGLCDMHWTLKENNYSQTSSKTRYRGSLVVDSTVVSVIVTVIQDSSLYVMFQEEKEELQYARQMIMQYIGHVDSVMASALSMADKYLFEEALATLDSVMGYYPPKDNEVVAYKKDIKDRRWAYYDDLKKNELSKNRYKRANELLDTLLIITPEEDSVNRSLYVMQKESLVSLMNRKAVRFSEVYPAEFDSICSQIGSLFNTDIRKIMYQYPRVEQKLRYSFHINTDTVNVSNGTVSLSCNTHNNDYLQKNVLRQDLLQKDLNRIAQSPLIKMKKENGVPVMTDETIEGELTFDYQVKLYDADDVNHDSSLTKYVRMVEREYLSERVRKGMDDNLREKYDTVSRKPTMERFTFGILRKSDGYRYYTDLKLINFETAMGASWMPSLLVPGMGTYNQKARSSISVRAVPFFLFAGLSAASFMWDNHVKNSGAELYEVNDPNLRNVLYVKNIGAWVGTACLAISATIYITDLVEGIGNSIRNVKYTRRLRNKLTEEGPIVLRWEDVVIPAGVDVQEENVGTETQTDSGSDENKEQ